MTFKAKVYPSADNDQEFVDSYLEQLEESNVMVPALQSPIGTPNNKRRLVKDFF